MKLNKKLCRTYANPDWKIPVNNGLIYAEQIKYIIRTAVKNIKGQRVLILYIYQRCNLVKGNSRPHWTMFQGREEYITLEQEGDNATRWRTAAFENLDKYHYYTNDKYAFFTPADEERVVKFCKKNNPASYSGLLCLEALQREIMRKRRNQRQLKKERVILNKMNLVPALPRNLKKYIQQELMPGYIFYDYHRNKKRITGHCTFCNQTVQTPDAKHNRPGKCPGCKKAITFKSRGRRGYFWDQATLQVIQKISEHELVIRYIKANYSYCRLDSASQQVYENARIFLHCDKPGQTTKEPYYLAYCDAQLTRWRKGTRPVYNQWQYNFAADTCGYLYHKNLDAVLSGTPWQYSQLKEYYAADSSPLYVPQYLDKYMKHPLLEYMVKLRLYNLATNIAYPDYYYNSPLNLKGKSFKEILGVEKGYLPLLQSANPGCKQLELMKTLLRSNITVTKELLTWCSQHKISEAVYLTTPLQYMTLHRLKQYADKQYEQYHRTSWHTGKGYDSMNALLSDYRDYLCMCAGLSFDLNNSFVLYPAKLEEAHDKVNQLSDKEKAQMYDELIRRQYADLNQQYYFKKNGYIIMLPRSSQELIDEGHKLHHCVANYVARSAKNECLILFVRKADQPEQPLCTVELRNYEISQARVFGNLTAPPPIQKFLDIWKQKVLYAPALSKAA